LETSVAATIGEMDDTMQGARMKIISKQGWKWTYRKLRELNCSRVSAFYRTMLYAIRGDTGSFYVDHSWEKIRIRR
jgi:hypothetical protein